MAKGHSIQGLGEPASLFYHKPVWLATKCEIPKAVSFGLSERFDCLTDA